MVIESSTDPIEFTYFSVFSAGSVTSTGTGLVSLIFTVSSVLLPISIAALAVGADPPSLYVDMRVWCGSVVRISPERALLATRISLYSYLLYNPG